MDREFAVVFNPGDGPDTLVYVNAESEDEAKAKVLGWFWRNDADAVTASQFTVTDLGSHSEVYWLDQTGFAHEIKGDY